MCANRTVQKVKKSSCRVPDRHAYTQLAVRVGRRYTALMSRAYSFLSARAMPRVGDRAHGGLSSMQRQINERERRRYTARCQVPPVMAQS